MKLVFVKSKNDNTEMPFLEMTSVKLIIFVLCFLLVLSFKSIAQPANNLCVDALSLTVGSNCSNQVFAINEATREDTDVAPNPTCGTMRTNDLWFKALVPASGMMRVEVTNGTNMAAQYAIYRGECESFTQLYCNNGAVPRNIYDVDLANEEIYIRVWNSNTNLEASFSICVWEPDVPVNDHCAAAFELMPTASCNLQTYSNEYTTAESTLVAANPTCGFYAGGDVWFKTVVPASGQLRVDVNNVSGISATYEILIGSCGSFSTLRCESSAGPRATNINKPELAGEELYVRVWNWNSAQGGVFTLCIWEPEMAPNDNCADPINMNVSDWCAPQTFSNRYATAEPTSVAQNPSCSFYRGGDVWFSAEVPESGKMRFQFQNVVDMGNLGFSIYTGNCGNLTEISCNQLNLINNFHRPNLAGEQLLIRVFNYDNQHGGEFTFCVWEPDIPDNDLCLNAVEVPVQGDECNFQAYTGRYTTDSGTATAPTPSCGFYSGGDVWFKAMMPSNGQMRIQTTNLSDMNSVITAYRGTCGSMLQLGCVTNRNLELNNPEVANEDVYIRIFNLGNRQAGDFSLCVSRLDCQSGGSDADSPEVITKDVTLPLDENGLATLLATDIDNDSFDNCTATEALVFELDRSSFSCEDLGEQIVNLKVTDASGNEASAVATVTIVDELAPAAIARNLNLSLDETGNVFITPAQVNNGSNDNCTADENLTIELGKTDFDCTDIGQNQVSFTVTDESGNASSINFMVTVNDNMAPIPNEENLPTIEATCSVSITGFPTAIDNCRGTFNAITNNPLFYNVPGEYTITWVFNDNNSNVVTQNQTVLVHPVDAEVVVDGLILTSNQEDAIYQWIRCGDDSPITGAVDRVFRPNSSGEYAVRIFYNSCEAQSDCISISVSALEDRLAMADYVQIFPNPTVDLLHIQLNEPQWIGSNYELFDVQGQMINSGRLNVVFNQIDLSSLQSGMYFLKLEKNPTQLIKVIKK